MLLFVVKILIGFVVLFASSRLPHGADFVFFNQFFILFALLNVVSTAGLQNGIIRETASAAAPERVAHVLAAALVVVVPIAALLVAGGTLAGARISLLLVGSEDFGWLVGAISLLAACSGFGQILCAVMTGTGRGRNAMLVQTLSLLLAGGATIWRLLAGDVVGAILTYAGGSALLPLVAVLFMAYLRPVLAFAWQVERAILTQLTRFSAAYLITASAMPLTLFALRAAYRHRLGEAMLSNWLAANRVSDVLTQFIGLYMTQVHLPRFAAAQSAAQASRIARHSIFTAAAIMATGAMVFFAAADTWIRVFLSARFLPAREIISVYVLGDTLRTLPSALMFTALALGRAGTSAGLELTNAAIFAAVTLVLLRHGEALAPAFGYIAGSMSVTIVGSAVLGRYRPVRRFVG